MGYLLGLDIGTSAVKALLLGTNGDVAGSVTTDRYATPLTNMNADTGMPVPWQATACCRASPA